MVTVAVLGKKTTMPLTGTALLQCQKQKGRACSTQGTQWNSSGARASSVAAARVGGKKKVKPEDFFFLFFRKKSTQCEKWAWVVYDPVGTKGIIIIVKDN